MKYWINITKDCNLKCTYCYQKDYHQFVYMDQRVADQVIDFIIREGAEQSAVNFFGGEALLNFKIIRYIVERLFVHGVTDFSITTNLVALTDEMADFFHQYLFNLLVSFDGTRDSHDLGRMTKNNQGTYDLVLSNLQKLESYPNVKIRIAKVLSMDNFQNFYQDYLFLKELGQRVLVNTLLDGMYLDQKTDVDIYQQQVYRVFADYIKSGNLTQFPYFKNYYQRYLKLSYQGAFKEDACEASCTKPENLQLVFDCAGKIHPCHMMVELEMDKTGIPICGVREPLQQRDELLVLNPQFAPFTVEEIYVQLEQEIVMKKCNHCRYLHNCLKYFLMHAKTSCVFRRYRRRIMIIDPTKKLLCFTRLVMDALDDLVESPIQGLQIGGDNHL